MLGARLDSLRSPRSLNAFFLRFCPHFRDTVSQLRAIPLSFFARHIPRKIPPQFISHKISLLEASCECPSFLRIRASFRHIVYDFSRSFSPFFGLRSSPPVLKAFFFRVTAPGNNFSRRIFRPHRRLVFCAEKEPFLFTGAVFSLVGQVHFACTALWFYSFRRFDFFGNTSLSILELTAPFFSLRIL